MTPVEKLELILEKLKTLKPEEFVFYDFVVEHDTKGCGTVCCVVGWFPKFFRNSGFVWQNGALHSKKYDSGYTGNIEKHLIDLIGLPELWIEYLFFGDSNRPNNNLPYLSEDDDLARVIYVWEKAIAYLKKHPSAYQEKYSLT